MPQPIALTIAGSDPSGGAGLQADLKTFDRLGIYGLSAVSMITCQNTKQIDLIEITSPELLRKQLETLLADFHIDAVKLGALGHQDNLMAISDVFRDSKTPIIMDPILKSSSGFTLLDPTALDYLRQHFLKKVYLLTPNLGEAEALLNRQIDSPEKMKSAAKEIHAMAGCNVLIKGGHLTQEEAVDILFEGSEIIEFQARRLDGASPHGTGCQYSAAITSFIAKGGGLIEAISKSKQWISEAIASSQTLGQGAPLIHVKKSVERFDD